MPYRAVDLRQVLVSGGYLQHHQQVRVLDRAHLVQLEPDRPHDRVVDRGGRRCEVPYRVFGPPLAEAGLASRGDVTNSTDRGSSGRRPTAARNWLSTDRAAGSQRVSGLGWVNIIQTRLRRSGGSVTGSWRTAAYAAFQTTWSKQPS